MPNKREQATKILSEALGVQEPPAAPPPPKLEAVKDAPEAPEAEPVESPPDTGNETDEPASLADVAELLGVEVADLYDVRVPMPDGEEPTQLGTLKDAERRARQLEKKLRGLESDHETTRKELEAMRAQGPAAFNGMPPELDMLRLRAAQWHEHVNGNEAYWRALRENDPAEFAAELTQAKTTAQNVAQQFQQALGQWQVYQKQQLDDLLSKKRAKLAEKDAGWADEDTCKSRYREISDWLRSEGAEVPDNLDQVLVDPGWATALHKAAAASKGLDNVKSVPKKVGSAKLRRGSLKRGGQQSTERLADLIKRADKTGKRTDKTAAATAILESALAPKTR